MKTRDVIKKMVLILMLMVIIISRLFCKIIIYVFLYTIILYIIPSMSDDETAKHDVIEAVFYDEEHGYVCKSNTDAKHISKSSTMDDIKKFVNKVSFRNKKGYTNYNSLIVNFPRDEFLVDIAEIRFLSGKYIYLFICIDIFFKVCLRN